MVSFFTKEQLEKFTTKRLLAYKNSLMQAVEEPSWEECDYGRVSKKDPEWQRVYREVKEILATRENVEPKIMNERDLKEAVTKGKELKKKLDDLKSLRDKEEEEYRKAEEVKRVTELRNEAQKYLNTLADKITQAVSQDKKYFTIMSYEARTQWEPRFREIMNLIKPKLDKMSLKYFEFNETSYRVLGYDPEHGYDQTIVSLNVYVPE